MYSNTFRVSGVLIEILRTDGSKRKDGKESRDQVGWRYMFLENFRYNPQHFSNMSPSNIRSVDFPEGDWGTVGSVIV